MKSHIVKHLKIKIKIKMTFSEYIIQERSKKFYFTSLQDMVRSNTNLTLEEWFSDLYTEYKIINSL